MSGPAMAAAIGYALHCPPMVLFSLIPVGFASNALGGAGGPLAVLFVAILAAELGKAVSKETKIDILVTPLVTIGVGVALSAWWAPALGAAAMKVGDLVMWATELQPFLMGVLVSVIVGVALTLPISRRPSAHPWGWWAWRRARRLPGAARRWSASPSCPSGRTAGAASSPRGSGRRCCRWATSSKTPASGLRRR